MALALLYIRLRYGKRLFPYLLDGDKDILVIDDILTPETCARLSERVETAIREKATYSPKTANRAALFTEEIGLTILEKNEKRKSPLLVEISLFFDEDSVLLIERDSGKVFDITDPDLNLSGLSSFVLSGLMESQKEKANQTTTGYNRNMMRFS